MFNNIIKYILKCLFEKLPVLLNEYELLLLKYVIYSPYDMTCWLTKLFRFFIFLILYSCNVLLTNSIKYSLLLVKLFYIKSKCVFYYYENVFFNPKIFSLWYEEFKTNYFRYKYTMLFLLANAQFV